MQAIIPNRPALSRPYAWGCITIAPDPPRVGRETTIGFPLMNRGPDEIVVERIDVRIALFGMGQQWEEVGSIGPIHLPPHPSAVHTATIGWTPTVGGHRCVRATIHTAGAEPLLVGRNLHVIEATADEDTWRLPFRLGNPERVAAPVMLELGGNDPRAVEGEVLIGGRPAPLGQPVWLGAGEMVEAELLLRARTDAALAHVRTLEAWIGGRLLDGIAVQVRRPARRLASDQPVAGPVETADVAPEPELVYAR
jgi:hypothetical protein